MKALSQCLLLLVLLTGGSSAFGQEAILVTFEQLPLPGSDPCPIDPYDRGATFVGGRILDWTTRVYRTHQAYFAYCITNPIRIFFDEPGAALVSFDLWGQNRYYIISDDQGWSQRIDLGYYGGNGLRVTVPSTGIREITIKDECDYYASSGCRNQYGFHIDNVGFTLNKPCLAINGPDEVEPNDARQTTKNVAAVVEVTDCNGNPLSDIELTIRIVPIEQSGGHLHEIVPFAFRPAGGLRNEGANGAGEESLVRSSDAGGAVRLEFVPPEVSGTYTIEVECVDFACNEPNPPHGIEVKIAGLEPIPPFDVFYTLKEYLPGTPVGTNIGDNGKHDSMNHWLTAEASETLWRVAFHYAEILEFQPDPAKLHVNDASLPMGGLFDIFGSWRPDHVGHRKGTVVDIRANQKPGAVPREYDEDFKKAARDESSIAVREFVRNPRDPREHYHLRLTGADQ